MDDFDEIEEEELLPTEDFFPEEYEDEEGLEEESILTEYDQEDFQSGAVTTPDSSIPIDSFEFKYSLGYDCHKYFNLCACDETVICWSAGSIITFMDVNTKQRWFRRSTTGGTVGSIVSYRKDPNYRIAIAEDREGEREPLIILYMWPQMEMNAVLRDGTTNAYSHMDFSPDGELLASVGKEPDFNITIWNWKKHKILLRTSAFSFEVDAVMFSPYCPGQLTTAGSAHIKFWKMAVTFTGLKLKGELGRFGKTEICDVLGVLPMPDEKVLSGCEWGNILVWEAGLVKVEVTQKGRKKCHGAPIIQFMLSESRDEVITIGQDGFMRAWYWDTVDQADPPEEDPFVELNPVAETEVPGCQIMCLKHKQDEFWYAQDGNGGLWTVDLELDKIECEHNKIMTCHAGPIVTMIMLRTHPVLITSGQDGCLHAYDSNTYALMAKYTYPAPITCMLYPPLDVDATSRILIVGFADGVVRILLVHPDRLEARSMVDIRVHSAQTLHSEDSAHSEVIDLISILKPHAKAITQITINKRRTLLVTCSQDSTLFMYKLTRDPESTDHFQLERLGFIETPNNVAYMTWKPDDETGRVLLLCGQVGSLIEAVLPDVDVRVYTEITTFMLEFESYRECLVKKQYIRYRPFPEEDDLASLDEEAIKAKAELLLTKDEEEEEWQGEIQLIESESMLGTTLTWAKYCSDGIWVVQEGTGALLKVQMGSNNIIKFAPIPDAWTDSLTTLQFICEKQYILIGTNTGYIRVLRMPTAEEDCPEYHYNLWITTQNKLFRALEGRRLAKVETQPIPRIDFNDSYYLPMHDKYTGAITSLVFTVDGDVLFSCGRDGNIFSYDCNFPFTLFPRPDIQPEIDELKIERKHEPSTVDGELMSHEQLKQKEEFDKMMAIANAHKKRVRELLANLTVEYNKLIKANRMLPCSQQIDITLDVRPLEFQERELEDAKALTKRKLAHQLEASDLGLAKMINRNIIQLDVFPFSLRGIRNKQSILRPIRHKNLSPAFMEQLEEVYRMMAEAALRGRRTESVIRRVAPKRPSWGPPRVASFLLGLPLKRPHPLKKALRNYRKRLLRHHIQFIEWSEHLSRKPDPKAMPPGAEEALREAEATIGNKVLKADPDYVSHPGHNTQLRVCLTRKEIHDNKHEFNEKVLELRRHKLHLVEKFKHIGERLLEIRAEVPPKMAKDPPHVPDIDDELEFPETNLEVNPIIQRPPQRALTAKSRASATKTMVFPQPRIQPPKVAKFRPFSELRPLSASWEFMKLRPDAEATAVETEIRNRRIERHLYEQDRLLDEAEVDVEKFDARLIELQRERIRVQEKNQLLELHLYQLHREMNVLNQFEAHEDRLAGRVYAKLMQVKAVQEQIHECENRIEEHFTEKETLDEKVQETYRQFKKLVADNKFADFLRRIFKKKYRPPRIRDEDDTSESSEESSSSEEDEGSLDSRDIGPIKLDINVCPEGCELETYNNTYDLRNRRHKYEQEMIEQDRLVDLLHKDIDLHAKLKRQLSIQLDKRKTQLKEFMMEKQSCMNEIESVVVLRYDQIRAAAVQGCTGPSGLSNTIVFPEALLNRLRQRVLELQDEIEQQKLRHRVNRTHLFRMNVDLKFMAEREKEIRAQMRDVLTKKLGKPRKVDKVLDSLLRQMARRHKYHVNFKMEPMAAQIRKWRVRNSEAEQKYLLALERHSTRLRLAAALQADVIPIKACLQPSTIMPGGYKLEDYDRDIIRLRIVRSQQLHQIKVLNEEITALRLQPLDQLFKPPPRAPSPPDLEGVYVEIARRPYKFTKKYFPLSKEGFHRMKTDINVMKLAFDCLDAMKINRDDAPMLIKDLLSSLPDVVSGIKTRYAIVDRIVNLWMSKGGGDPSQYKKQTKVFDAVAALAERLLRDHVNLMEGPSLETTKLMEKLEETLKEMVNVKEPLQDRLGPALATLLFGGEVDDVITEDTLTSLVRILLSEEDYELVMDDIDRLQAFNIVEDIKECGIALPETDLIAVVAAALDCLRAQVIDEEEEQEIEVEAESLLEEASEYRDASDRTREKETDRKSDDESAKTGWAQPRPKRPIPRP